MGCDIHLYFEKKNKQGVWEKIEIDERILPDDRNYRLFSFLAGVRNYEEFKFQPQFANRDIPNDTSLPGTDTDDIFMGDHSFTHAYLDEILRAPWGPPGLEDCYFIIFCEYVLPKLCSFCGSLSKDDERNIRVIMGFDN
jgi:hypothetical protein